MNVTKKPVKTASTRSANARLDDLLHALAFVVARRQMQRSKAGAYLSNWNLVARAGI